jgi:uncharacterized protein YbjQ (UPF0145 family)
MFPSKTTLLALVLVLGSTSSGFAGNDMANYSIRQALDSADAREKLDPRIKLSFGHRGHGPVAKHIGRWKSYKKANGFARADELACQRAFISAVISLQDRAKKMGGNAVVNINSYYDNRETSNDSTYVCGSGGLMSAVALMGSVVQIGK